MDTAEYAGYDQTKRTSKEEDFLLHPELSKYVINEIEHIDFLVSLEKNLQLASRLRVNPQTKKIEFAYQKPDLFEKPMIE